MSRGHARAPVSRRSGVKLALGQDDQHADAITWGWGQAVNTILKQAAIEGAIPNPLPLWTKA